MFASDAGEQGSDAPPADRLRARVPTDRTRARRLPFAAVGDPMKVAAAMMAFQRQAAEAVAATRAELVARGLGFDPDLVAAIAAEAAANPEPPAYDPSDPAVVAQAQEVARQAMEADYPEDGFAPDDPRLAPVDGMTIVVAAMAAKAIGWSTDVGHRDRVAAALGFDGDTYQRAAAGWQARVAADVVLAAYYGQLFAAA